MNHLTDLQCSMSADDALPAEQAEPVAEHLSSCAECTERVAAYSRERSLIRAALSGEDAVTVPAAPRFRKSMDFSTFALVNLGTGLLVWLAQFLWKTLFGELIVNLAGEFAALFVPDAYELTVDTAMHFYTEGTAMIETYLGFIVTVFVLLGGVLVAHYVGKARGMMTVCTIALLATGLAAPKSVFALELRRGEGVVTVSQDETVDDTLIAAGETVVIDGNINGDLFAAGRRVVVKGNVSGNVIAFAESVSIEGEVGGLTLGAGSSFELIDAKVLGDFWAAGEKVRISDDATVGGNATMAAESAIIEGRIGRDLSVAGETVELSGTVGEDVEAFGARMNLLGNAVVEGNLRFRGDEDRLSRSPGSTINGAIEFLEPPEQLEPRNRYFTVGFYARELLGFAAAFLTGFIALWAVPALRDAEIVSGAEGFKTAGIGLVALVSLPIISVLVAITLVGLPLTVIGLFTWALSIYLSKIVVASFIGQLILSGSVKEFSLPLTLLAGLGVVLVATNIPAIGGIVSFILTIVGMGMIVQVVLDYASDLRRSQQNS